MSTAPHHVTVVANHLTFGGAAMTSVLYGLHLSDLFMAISCAAAVAGAGMQIYTQMVRIRLLKKSAEWTAEARRTAAEQKAQQKHHDHHS